MKNTRNNSKLHDESKNLKSPSTTLSDFEPTSTSTLEAANTSMICNLDRVVLKPFEPTKEIVRPSDNTKSTSARLYTEVVKNPALRKDIILKIVKYLEMNHHLQQEAARDMTLCIEKRIRLSSPEMKEEYKQRSVLITALLKVNKYK